MPDVTEMNGKDENANTAVVPVPSRGRLVAIMISCITILYFSYGVIMCLGVLYVEFIDYFNASRSEAVLVQSLFGGFCLCGGVLFTNALAKFDAGIMIAGTSSILAVSLMTSVFAPNIQTLIFLLGVVAGLATSINILGAFVIISWTFKENRRFALGLLTVASTVAQVTMPYITIALLDTYRWQGAIAVLGSFTLHCIPCGLLIHFSKQYFDKGDNSESKLENLIDKECLSDCAFLIFLATCFFLRFAGLVEIWFIIDLAVTKGFTITEGATLSSLMGIFGFLGRLMGSGIFFMLPNVRPELFMAFFFLTFAFGHVTVSQSPVYWGIAVGIVVRSLSDGLVMSMVPSLQIDIRGLKKFPQTLSICNFLYGIGGSVGGYLGGITFDITGSYSVIFFTAAAVNVFNAITMIIIFFIFRHRRKHQTYETLK